MKQSYISGVKDDHRTQDEIIRGIESQIRHLQLLAKNLGEHPTATKLWYVIGPLSYWKDQLVAYFARQK